MPPFSLVFPMWGKVRYSLCVCPTCVLFGKCEMPWTGIPLPGHVTHGEITLGLDPERENTHLLHTKWQCYGTKMGPSRDRATGVWSPSPVYGVCSLGLFVCVWFLCVYSICAHQVRSRSSYSLKIRVRERAPLLCDC